MVGVETWFVVLLLFARIGLKCSRESQLKQTKEIDYIQGHSQNNVGNVILRVSTKETCFGHPKG